MTHEALGVAGEGLQPSLTAEALRGRALALLARREHSRLELYRKLIGSGADENAICELLDELQSRSLLSDERFAEIFIRSRVARGYGPVAILRELKDRGLSGELAGQALGSADCDWFSHAAEVRQRRFGPEGPAEIRERARQYRFLQYRGFSGDQISFALEGEFPSGE